MAFAKLSQNEMFDPELGALSIDDFLGGDLKLFQPVEGYRASMDTVMLQAAIPAKDGDNVLEAGTGSGAAALCLLHRKPKISATGVDIQSGLLRLAERNAHYNGLADRFSLVEACISDKSMALKQESFDHVMANPPYIEAGRGLSSPAGTKGTAHMNSTATLQDWVGFVIRMAKHKGTVSFIYRADRVHELLYYLYGKVGDIILCPLWPRFGEPAKRVLVQGKRGSNGSTLILPGLALHGSVERYTPEAEAVLRNGGALDLKNMKLSK